jgi:hypothetical protein
MLEQHEEPGWLTPEQEATLDAIAKMLRPKTQAELDETNRRCAEATRYRLRQERASDGQAGTR